MSNTHLVAAALSIAGVALGPGLVFGQDFPTKPIRIIALSGGGSNDTAARLLAEAIAGPLGQPVIVDNRPPAVVGEIAAKATPDGYTLIVQGPAVFSRPFFATMSYDPVASFAPISIVAQSPLVLIVPAQLPVASVKDLIALAKSKPGELNYAFSSIGGGTHLASELFKYMAGVRMVGVAYKGAQAGNTAVMSNEVQVMFSDAAAALSNAKTGRLKAIAITSAEPSALYPGIPTVAASGLPGYDKVGIDGIFAPANTPPAVISRLNQEIVRFVRTPAAKERFLQTGTEAVGSSPQELAVFIKKDMERMAKLINEVGIKVE